MSVFQERLATLAGFSAISTTRALSAAGGLVLLFSVSAQMGAEAAGRVALFITLVGAVSILSRGGMDFVAVRELSRLRESVVPRELICRGIRYTMGLSLLTVPLALILINYVYQDARISWYAFVLVILIPVLSCAAVFSGYFKSTNSQYASAFFEPGFCFFLASIFFIGAPVFFSASTSAMPACSLALAGALVWLMMAGVLYFLTNRPSYTTKPRAGCNAPDFEGRLSFVVIALSTFLAQAGSVLLVSGYLTPEEIGVVKISQTLGLLVVFPALAISSFIMGKVARLLSKAKKTEVMAIVRTAMTAAGLVALCVFSLLFLVADEILFYWGSDYSAVKNMLLIFSFSQVAVATLSPAATIVQMGSAEKQLMFVTVATLAIAATVFPLVASKYGATGFAVAWAALSVCRAMLVAFLAVGVMRNHLRARDKL